MSMRRRLNGSYQGKRAMRIARQRAKCKRQVRNRPNYERENEIFHFAMGLVFLIIMLYYIYWNIFLK